MSFSLRREFQFALAIGRIFTVGLSGVAATIHHVDVVEGAGESADAGLVPVVGGTAVIGSITVTFHAAALDLERAVGATSGDIIVALARALSLEA